MNQLTTQAQQFSFIPKTNVGGNIQDIADFITDTYIDAMFYWDDQKEFDIPSKSMIVSTAWAHFEDMYMQYIQNGHDEQELRDIQEELNEDPDLTLDDIVFRWIDFKSYNKAFYNGQHHVAYTNKELEYQLVSDMHKGIQMFDLSYFNDTNNDNFMSDGEINFSDWINPPIVGVW